MADKQAKWMSGNSFSPKYDTIFLITSNFSYYAIASSRRAHQPIIEAALAQIYKYNQTKKYKIVYFCNFFFKSEILYLQLSLNIVLDITVPYAIQFLFFEFIKVTIYNKNVVI